jgi:spore maturation protein CgeB
MPFKIDIDVRGQNMIDAIRSYKIHFNKNISVDVNYRNFETMGCGTLLLTDHNDQYAELGFKPETNVFVYKNIEEAVEIINFLKNKEDIISEVSARGLEFVKTKHTFKNRAKSLIKFINSL